MVWFLLRFHIFMTYNADHFCDRAQNRVWALENPKLILDPNLIFDLPCRSFSVLKNEKPNRNLCNYWVLVKNNFLLFAFFHRFYYYREPFSKKRVVKNNHFLLFTNVFYYYREQPKEPGSRLHTAKTPEQIKKSIKQMNCPSCINV